MWWLLQIFNFNLFLNNEWHFCSLITSLSMLCRSTQIVFRALLCVEINYKHNHLISCLIHSTYAYVSRHFLRKTAWENVQLKKIILHLILQALALIFFLPSLFVKRESSSQYAKMNSRRSGSFQHAYTETHFDCNVFKLIKKCDRIFHS